MKRLALLALLFTGCGATPMQKDMSSVFKGIVESREKTSVEKLTEGEKTPVNTVAVTPSVTVTGSSNWVDVKIEPPEPPAPLPPTASYRQSVRVGQVTSDATVMADSSAMSMRLPLSVAILFAAVGLGLLLLVWRSATKSSAALGAFAEVVDDYFAAEIRKHRSIATTATDSAEIARHLAAVGELEANRGRISL